MPSTLPGLGPRPVEAAGAASRVIVGGVVAHNDERRIEASLRSLLSQELPSRVRWGRVWVVASGCTDRTVEIARAVAEEDPRVSVVVEAERRGKAAAIRQVLSRAEGDFLVLLNSDAVAAPGAVGSLLTKATGRVHSLGFLAPHMLALSARVPREVVPHAAAAISGFREGWVSDLGPGWPPPSAVAPRSRR